MIKHIPNMLTLCNLFCGCIAISFCFNGSFNALITGSYFIFAAAIFDFFDGFAARLLKAHSAIGKQLDSLADMVTFGVAPSFFIFQLLNFAIHKNGGSNIMVYMSFLIAVFSCLRLAKFNIDESQSTHFIGVPTPINGMMLVAFPSLYMMFYNTPTFELASSPMFLLALTVISSLMLVAPVKMIALKFTDFSIKNNLMRYILIFISLIVLMRYQVAGLTIVYLFYVGISIINNFIEKK